MENIIVHYDMDAFYASIEERENKSLKEIPMAIGRGVILTANYKARKYGIRSAMTTKLALQKYKDLKLVEPRMELYKSVGREIQKFISDNFCVIEFISFDEGYINITEMINNKSGKLEEKIYKFIYQFQKRIIQKFNLTCSVGVGYNMISAKIASDVNKPAGFFVIKNTDEFNKYVIDKKISIIPGIGIKTIDILNSLSVYTVKDFLMFDKNKLNVFFSENRIVDMNNLIKGIGRDSIHNKNKSISNEITFTYSEINPDVIFRELESISKKLYLKIYSLSQRPKTISIKVKFEDFTIITRSKTINFSINSSEEIYEIAKNQYLNLNVEKKIRLIGINLTNFDNIKYEKQTLF